MSAAVSWSAALSISKDLNPRTGIKTYSIGKVQQQVFGIRKTSILAWGLKLMGNIGSSIPNVIRNTSILARGLKRGNSINGERWVDSKHLNPREGIKTNPRRSHFRNRRRFHSKHLNPREGIKTVAFERIRKPDKYIRKTAILARGLKRRTQAKDRARRA
ncbi:hypothetical protein [Herpetosiphon geysericola]|uniref:Uncharacterized protein n=1 Tax=Herpetosiphon geysericola TaxID=70996 RepID=A0A0N8GRC9_9CHLR|nr:hypothetical protein [Herpetosiphon geysericola]KPL86146.1 hypothetical protein SE18_14910 [Herpetosiphon geysericola]